MVSMKFSNVRSGIRYSIDFDEVEEDGKLELRMYGSGTSLGVVLEEDEMRKLRRFLSVQINNLPKKKDKKK